MRPRRIGHHDFREARFWTTAPDYWCKGLFSPSNSSRGPTEGAPLRGGRLVIKMDRTPLHAVKDPPNLVRSGSFSLDRLLSHIDPGPAEESEAFVHLIYEQRHLDVSSGRNRETRS